MERRFLLFLVLSFLLLTANALWNAPKRGPQPAGKEDANQLADDEGDAAAADPAAGDEAAKADPEGAAPADDDEVVAAADGPAEADEPAAEAAAGDEPEAPLEYVTLGSVDEESPYRMLVTFTNRGAGVRRLELSSPRYLDVHDRGGYLGHLELLDDGGAGLLVQTVGAGTPAAAAGLQEGDRLLEAGREKITAIKTPADVSKLLDEAKPRQKFTLVVDRAGERKTIEIAKLARRPLEVIRPESENVLLRTDKLPAGFVEPASFLLTLQEFDKEKIAEDATELAGVKLLESNWRIVDEKANGDSVTFEQRLPKQGLVITKRYELAKVAPKGEDAAAEAEPAYDLTVELTIKNDGGDQPRTLSYRLDGPNGLPIEGWWYGTKIGREWSAAGIRDVIGRYVGGEPQQQGAPQIASGDVEDFEGASPMAYMGVDAQYFCVSLIPQTSEADESWISRAQSVLVGPKPDSRKSDGRYANTTCRLISHPLTLKAGEAVTHKYQIFAGPKRPDLLAKYDYSNIPAYSLNDYVYYGWFSFVARLMVGLLHVFYGVVGNYGLAIVMLTVLVRGLMFPISRGQAKSMVKMQELRPEMDRIKEKYKGDQQKQAQAMQQLYRKHGVNPLAGCLPMLIQLPVFIGLYRGLAVDVELRGAPLISERVRWCSDLAAPDMLYNWSAWMPDFINRGEGIFGLGPYLNVLPLVTIVLWILQQKILMPPPANEQAEMQQKIMKYMMIFMALLFYKVPSGLCLYFIASSIWSIGERKLAPPPTAAVGVGGAPATPSTPEKRLSRNGQADGKSKAKSKRGR